MKNENVHMQALHHKLDVVLVQILRYNCSETDYRFCEDLPPAGLRPLPSDPFSPHTIFCSAAPGADLWLGRGEGRDPLTSP